MFDHLARRAAQSQITPPGVRSLLRSVVMTCSFCLACASGWSCTPGPASPATQAIEFNAERAWKDLEAQLAIGTRQAGTPGAEATRVYLEQELRAAGLKPIREAFRQATPIGELDFANVYVDLPPATSVSNAPWILLCTHYDTKRLPGGFVGANDGASGTAVLLELARSLSKVSQRGAGYRLLFIDGEESVNVEWVDPDNRYGSKYHAAKLKESGRASSFKACVLLDLIGDKDLVIELEGVSDEKIYAHFVAAARELKLGKHFSPRRGQEIIDDHRMFMAIGIRSVDLIDFNYGPNNSLWHTLDYKVENCSKQSLDTVGR